MMSGGDGGNVTTPAKDSVATRMPVLTDTQKVVESAPPGSGVSADEPEGKKPDDAATGTGADAKSSRPAPPAPGFLKVLSRPKNASIYINGELQYEKTPFTFDRPPGRYTVRILQIVGGREVEYSKTVTLASGETQIVSHNFEE
jgi:hypothetical protein